MELQGQENRRHSPRLPMSTVVGIDTPTRKDRGGVTWNVSAGGLYFHSFSRFEIGEEVEIRIRVRPGTDEEYRRVPAVVVRSEENSPDRTFPHLTAVKFQEPIEELRAGDANAT